MKDQIEGREDNKNEIREISHRIRKEKIRKQFHSIRKESSNNVQRWAEFHNVVTPARLRELSPFLAKDNLLGQTKIEQLRSLLREMKEDITERDRLTLSVYIRRNLGEKLAIHMNCQDCLREDKILDFIFKGLTIPNTQAYIVCCDIIRILVQSADNHDIQFLIDRFKLMDHIQQMIFSEIQDSRQNALWIVNNVMVIFMLKGEYPILPVLNRFVVCVLQGAKEQTPMVELCIWYFFILSQFKYYNQEQKPFKIIEKIVNALTNIFKLGPYINAIKDLLDGLTSLSVQRGRTAALLNKPEIFDLLKLAAFSNCVPLQQYSVMIWSNLMNHQDYKLREKVASIDGMDEAVAQMYDQKHQQFSRLVIESLKSYISVSPLKAREFSMCEQKDLVKALESKFFPLRMHVIVMYRELIRKSSNQTVVRFIEKEEEFLKCLVKNFKNRYLDQITIKVSLEILQYVLKKAEVYFMQKGKTDRVIQEVHEIGVDSIIIDCLDSNFYKSDSCRDLAIKIMDTYFKKGIAMLESIEEEPINL